jgi:hypothetical protein
VLQQWRRGGVLKGKYKQISREAGLGEELASVGEATSRGRARGELGDGAEVIPRADEVRRRPRQRCDRTLGLGFQAAGWGPSLHAYGPSFAGEQGRLRRQRAETWETAAAV